MAVTVSEIISAQTAAKTSEFTVDPNDGSGFPATLMGWGFSGGDSVAIEINYDDSDPA